MAILRPFVALRPAPGTAARVASPPYDVVDTREARAIAKTGEASFLFVSRPEIALPEGTDEHSDAAYAQGKTALDGLVSEGALVRAPGARLFLYAQTMGTHRQIGVVACASVDEYDADTIKKHEKTRPDKEDDRTRHIDELGAHDEPVFLTYRARPEIGAIVSRVSAGPADEDFTTSDGVRHETWTLSESDTAALAAAFTHVPALYVADGHHRTAAAVRTGQALRARHGSGTGEEPWEYFMAVVFPHDQLQILDYNRVVKDLGGLSPEEFLRRVSERFEVAEAATPRPEGPARFGMYLGGRWYRLVARRGTYPEGHPVLGLDVSILQNNLLGPVLGIADPRTDKRIDFVGGIRGTAELERRVKEGWAVAFALHPTSLDQLMAVADAGEVMPPKSTWFEPKLRSGLLVRLIEE